MVAYSFKGQFSALIRSGQKTQTIRSDRKRHARPGEALQLYAGMRTRSWRLLATALCDAVVPVRLVFGVDPSVETLGVTDRDRDLLSGFARDDGFADWTELEAFWAKAHPGCDAFEGVLISWAVDSVVPA